MAEYKFRAHETFFIRKGWLSKGMKYVEKTNGEVFISKTKNPMDELGLGSNMVKSLRYWLQASGLTTEENQNRKRVQQFTELGKEIFDNDRYIEELGTLYLLQYKLASNKTLATSWYFFFNEFHLTEFSQDDFLTAIQNFISMNSKDEKTAGTVRTLTDDFNCIINTYIPRYKTSETKPSAENNIDCPLGELGLINIISKKAGTTIYKKTTPDIQTINAWILLAVILDNANEKSEISLNELLTENNNIGRVFNLDSITLIDALRLAEKINELKIIRTAGLDVIQLTHPKMNFMDCVKKYYKSLENKEATK